jgi:hypothetical protein
MSGSVCTPAETAIRGSTRKGLTDNISRMLSDDKRADEGGNDVPKTDGNE